MEDVTFSTDKELEPNYMLKDETPENVLNWQKYSSWRDEFWRILDDLIDEEIKVSFLNHPPEFIACDDLTWLDEIIWKVKAIDINSKEMLSDRLLQRYKAIRAVHGTRTADIRSFYTDGLLPLVPEMVHERASLIFLQGNFPELTEKDLENAIVQVGSDLREGRVYFEANEAMLLEHCCHYMAYGSEYLLALAAHLGRSRDYRQTLKKFGEPTVFVCDIPLSMMSSYTLDELSGVALSMIFENLLEGDRYEPDLLRGFGFCIRQPLAPMHIVGHYHPEIINDPFY